MLCCCLQLPEEAKELEKELRQITKEKNEAVRGQDFEKVLSLSCTSKEPLKNGCYIAQLFSYQVL